MVARFFLLLFSAAHAFSASLWDMSLPELKDMIDQRIFAVEATPKEVYSIEELALEREDRTTPIRVYRPNAKQGLPVLLLIHGGAWIAGSLDTHDYLARYLSAKTEAVVVSVGYTNSPEGKFPLPLEQCYDALLWAAEEINGEQIAVVGDSAGGNLAAALCLMAKDRAGPALAAQILINPAPDLTCKGTLERQDDDLDRMRIQARAYVTDPNDTFHPYVSPILAKDLSGLPPALILLAEQDPLRQDGQAYADRLKEAEVPTQVYIQQGIGHLAGDGARASQKAEESLQVAVLTLKKTFLTP